MNQRATGIARPGEACGTNRAYNRHTRRGEPTCAACRAAHTAFNAARQAAQQRAYARLARQFAAQYRQLYADELRASGLNITPQPTEAVRQTIPEPDMAGRPNA